MRFRLGPEEPVVVNKFWQKESSKAKQSKAKFLRAAAAAALKQVVRLMHISNFFLAVELCLREFVQRFNCKVFTGCL